MLLIPYPAGKIGENSTLSSREDRLNVCIQSCTCNLALSCIVNVAGNVTSHNGDRCKPHDMNHTCTTRMLMLYLTIYMSSIVCYIGEYMQLYIFL